MLAYSNRNVDKLELQQIPHNLSSSLLLLYDSNAYSIHWGSKLEKNRKATRKFNVTLVNTDFTHYNFIYNTWSTLVDLVIIHRADIKMCNYVLYP